MGAWELMRRAADSTDGWAYDPQSGEGYPDGPDPGQWAIDEGEARAWVARLPQGWATARRILMALLAALGVAFLVLSIIVLTAERQAGGRFNLEANHRASLAIIGPVILAVVTYFAYTACTDRYHAQLRQTAREWWASRERPPWSSLPLVFIPAFAGSQVKQVIALVAWVIATGLILGGIGYIHLDLPDAPQPSWLWGGSAILMGVLAIILGFWFARLARPQPRP
jgi:uncharacterized membrane protein HdeD (DUF308 family)